MIGQELSFYPESYAEEQRMAERLSRPPEVFAHSLGNTALNDTTTLLITSLTGGILESAPANTTPHERQPDVPHEELQRELAASALSSMMVRQQPIHEALTYQSEFDLAA